MLPLSTTDSSRWWSKLRDLGSVSGLTGQAPVKDRLRWECWETSSVDNREAKSSGSLAGDALHVGKHSQTTKFNLKEILPHVLET